MNLNKYYDKYYALVFLGGNSINKYIHRIKKLDKRKFIFFFEPRSISKKLLDYDIKPDFIICPFSVKLKDNNFQNIILRSFLSGVDIKKFIKKKYYDEVNFLKKNFNKIYEEWRPSKGIHKKYKIKNNIFLANSPMENLQYFEDTKIFLDLKDYKENFSDIKLKNKIINIEFKNFSNEFNINEYYNIEEESNKLIFKKTNFMNTHSICHFPLLNFLGFKKIFFAGMDMNFYGNYEHENLNIFKTKMHFYIFLFLVRNSLNGNFKLNFPIYLRPKEEFNNLREILKFDHQFYRITSTNDIKIPEIKSIKVENFFNRYK